MLVRAQALKNSHFCLSKIISNNNSSSGLSRAINHQFGQIHYNNKKIGLSHNKNECIPCSSRYYWDPIFTRSDGSCARLFSLSI
jgi:hypothetical protein